MKLRSLNAFALFFLLFGFQNLRAQTDFTAETYDFDDAALTSAYMDSSGFEICTHWSRRFTESKLTPGGQFANYILSHRLLQVNNLSAAESYNKIYFPVKYSGEFWTLKARVIKDGKVVYTSSKSDIKEVEVEGAKYQLLALEKVDAGCYIESITASTSQFSEAGSQAIQNSTKMRESAFTIIVPKQIKCISKMYNSDAEVKETTIGERRFYEVKLTNVADNRDEDYTFSDPYAIRMEFKLVVDKEGSTTKKWADIGREFYETHMKHVDENKSPINKLLKEMKVADQTDLSAKVFIIEDFIKKNFNIVNATTEDNLSDMIKKKYCSAYGLIRLMMYCFHYSDINYDLIGTCKRSDRFFDKDFESTNYFTDVLFYFPELKSYVDPNSNTLRMPVIDNEFLGQDCMRIRVKEFGGVRNAVTTTSSIEENPCEKSIIGENYVVDFKDELSSTITHYTRSFSGFADYGFRALCYYANAEERDKTLKDIIQNLQENSKVENLKFENYNLSDQKQCNSPFIMKADLTGEDLLELAGSKTIFKLGEVIGAQHTMYNTKPRQHPVNIDYTHEYVREIIVNIPDGYKVSGQESIKLDKECKGADGTVLAAFHSEFEMKGNQLVVRIRESYLHLNVPFELYEDFRDVVNAAADFNRVSLVIEKIG